MPGDWRRDPSEGAPDITTSPAGGDGHAPKPDGRDLPDVDWPLDPPPSGPAPGAHGGGLARLLGLKRRERVALRLRALNRAIADYPDAPANYVLRGELYLKLGEPAQAAADFQMASALAAARYEGSDWGLIDQALRDRAETGLRRAQRRLGR